MFNTQLIGYIGQDAVARDVPNARQTAIGFSVAVSERYTDAQGVKHERTTWVDCTLWRDKDKLGIVPYLVKGQLVYVEGRVEAASYIDKETGDLRQKLRLRVKEVNLLGGSSVQQHKPAQPQMHPSSPQYQQPPVGWQPQQPYGAIDQSALQRMHQVNSQTAQQQPYVPPAPVEDDLPF